MNSPDSLTLSTSFQHRTYSYHFIFSLPSEILGMIIAKMGVYVVKNVRTLMFICTKLRKHVKFSIQYIDRMFVARPFMLELFTGIKHLEIIEYDRGKCASPGLFSKNIFGNLKTLIIPSILIFLLNEYSTGLDHSSDYCLDHSSDYSSRMCYSSSHPQKSSFSLCTTYFLPKLKSLTITEEYHRDFSGTNIGLDIDPGIMPCLREVKMFKCMLNNINQFKTLEVLDISNTTTDISILNKLNISELRIFNVDQFHNNRKELDIPSLRKLTIRGYFSSMNLNNLNLTELILLNIECSYDYLNDRSCLSSMKIPTLRKLVLKGVASDNIYVSEDDSGLCDGYMDIGYLTNLNIEELILADVEHCHYIGSTIPSLRKLVLISSGDVSIEEFPNLERLTMFKSYLTSPNRRMEKLNKINTIESLPTWKFNSLTYPRLRNLNIHERDEESLKDTLRNLEKDMPDVVVSSDRQKSMSKFRYLM